MKQPLPRIVAVVVATITNGGPPGDPGSLSPEAYVDVLAYILQQNGVWAGQEPLRADPERLREIRMAEADSDAPPLAPPFLAGARARPSGTGSMAEDLREARSDAGDWLHHTRDLQGTRSAPLAELDPSDAHSLRPVSL